MLVIEFLIYNNTFETKLDTYVHNHPKNHHKISQKPPKTTQQIVSKNRISS